MEHASDTDRIERSIVIEAPREKVWNALADAEAFGNWFGADLQGQTFRPGQRTRGKITFKGYEHLHLDVVIDRMQPRELLSFHWHPYPVDPAIDYSAEQPTLVTFTLQDAGDRRTLLTIVESGFDSLPLHRRLEAFRMNGAGWDGQLTNIVRHVTT